MSGLEIATLLLIEAVCGAGGALAVTRLWPKAALEWKSAAAIGVAGGLARRCSPLRSRAWQASSVMWEARSTPPRAAPAALRPACWPGSAWPA